MPKYRSCTVPGCKDKTSHRHRFPNPNKSIDLFNTWVEVCGNESLKTLAPDLVYRSHRVCHIHFRAEDGASNMYLKKGTVPQLFLPLKNSDVNKCEENVSFEHRFTSSNTGLPYEEVHISEEYRTPKRQKLDVEVSLLKEVGVSRVQHLTPKACKLYNRARKLSKSLKKLRTRTKFVRRNIMSNQELVDHVTSPIDKTIAGFIRTQINLANTSPKGRRYTLNDKVMGLIMQKQCGKGYKTLSKIFCLPSRRTLVELLRKIPIEAGTSGHIFNNLRANVALLRPQDKLCVLIFDEMSLEPHIDVNKHLMEFEGFEDLGDSKTDLIADHVQLFMVRGLIKNWKQPLAYRFCRGTTKTIDIVRNIKQVITKCQEAGLEVIATISDQGATNQAAVNYLVNSNRERSEYTRDLKIYKVNYKEIVHIYDPPHLIKGIRNNLLTKHLIWKIDGKTLCAKWEHIIKAYEIDNTSGELRTMPKLTDQHIYASKIKKMKVSYATQIFSHTVASVITLMTRTRVINDCSAMLPKEALDTAKILKFYDTLFDSVNGTRLYPQRGKSLKCVVSSTSGHIEFWRQARKNITLMHFQQASRQVEQPSSLKNWNVTLAGLEYIYNIIKQHNLNYYQPRNVNQDPVENFFGQIRQYGIRNNNPTISHFKTYFKTLLINNLVTRHSLAANCEHDESDLLIHTVREFVLGNDEPTTEEFNGEIFADIIKHVRISPFNFSFLDQISIGYVSGFLANKIKTITTCEQCKNNIICKDRIQQWHELVIEREYIVTVPNRLKYCTPKCIKGLGACYNIILTFLPHICKINNSILHLITYLNENVKFNFPHFCVHLMQLEKDLIKNFTMLCCTNWALGINRRLTGKDTRKNLSDKIYVQAREYYLKRKKKRN